MLLENSSVFVNQSSGIEILPTEILPNMLQTFYYIFKSSYRVLGSVLQIHTKVKGKFNSHKEGFKKSKIKKKEKEKGILSMCFFRDRSENVFLEDFIPDACQSNREYH